MFLVISDFRLPIADCCGALPCFEEPRVGGRNRQPAIENRQLPSPSELFPSVTSAWLAGRQVGRIIEGD